MIYILESSPSIVDLGSPQIESRSAASDPSREFLRTANDILLSLLSTDQKSQFLHELCTTPSTSAILSGKQRNELLGEAVQLKAKSKQETVQKLVQYNIKAFENDSSALSASNINWSSIASNIGTSSRHNSLEVRRSRSPLKSSASGNHLHLAEVGPGIRSPAFAPGVKRFRSTSPNKPLSSAEVNESEVEMGVTGSGARGSLEDWKEN